MYQQLTTLIFDLDGVITSEKKYWNTARLTVWDLITSDSYLGLKNYFDEGDDFLTKLALVGEKVISSQFVYELKRRAVNSNWDLTFFVMSLHLLGILNAVKVNYPEDWSNIIGNPLPVNEELARLKNFLQKNNYTSRISDALIGIFWEETQFLTGTDVVGYVSLFSERILGAKLSYLQPKGDLWQLCYHNFQEWYETKGCGVLPDDDTVLDLGSIGIVLQNLRDRYNYTLGIATGRPRNEVIQPLSKLGLLEYFDKTRIVTYDEVLDAEAILSRSGNSQKLGKPHPFVVLKALYPDENVEIFCSKEFQSLDRKYAAYIGDATSDVVAAKQAGCLSIGVLTGVFGDRMSDKQQSMLKDVGCDVILNSVLELPMLLGNNR
ncbi:HAD hydrolase-like protein [Scytonema sp. UIC 10036]|uniref:HAD family hydrolase n=1 Tax=Scytonema sp. UIC 10036 TaxID=2304196 RepID=UPI0012DAD921|nr:HAD hydrolase-like protein [Scytonema sp. UIC 10036]MUG96572.1 HAD hydrolase-like protein [Scytonema sp. UIC 10036]